MQADGFFFEARRALTEGRPLVIDAGAALRIAASEVEAARFRSLAREINDEALRDLLIVYFENLKRAENRRARSAESWAEGVKLGVGGIGASTVVTGVASIIATGGAVAALFAVGCGIGGLVIAVGGNSYFKSRINRSRDATEDMDFMLASFKR